MRKCFFPTNGTFFFIVFLKYRDKLSTKQSSDKLEIPCGTKFLWVLIFTIFVIFPSIRKIISPPKINDHIFPGKIYSRVLNILWLKFTTQKYSTKTPCLFNYKSPVQFRNQTVYNELVLRNVRIP